MPFHALSSPEPSFSNLKLRSKTCFSSRILSMVKPPLFVDPASGGSPASLRKASRVYRTQKELLVSIA